MTIICDVRRMLKTKEGVQVYPNKRLQTGLASRSHSTNYDLLKSHFCPSVWDPL